jgi:N-acyl-D-amino-acid deacylase
MQDTRELLIRGGTVVDGTGAPARRADVAVRDGVIVAVGTDAAAAVDAQTAETIDATGCIVTPGFVDVHTHYDGQATWDPLLEPSSNHGVTTLVMGNCGVGFAPVQPGKEQWLIELMEAVEDIPGTALSEGMAWSWESFPEYLDALDRRTWAVDVATQVPHAALRAYVMGRRGADNEPATDDDCARMAALVREALDAGALGFSTSRTLAHRTKSGEVVPGTHADERELFAIGDAMRAAGKGVYEIVPLGAVGEQLDHVQDEIDWIVRLAERTGRPFTFVLTQVNNAPDLWRDVFATCDAALARGVQVRPQISGRPTGVLFGLDSRHPFVGRPSYDEVAHLPVPERARALADPTRRARILAETATTTQPSFMPSFFDDLASRLFVLGTPPDYEPGPEKCVAAIARSEGVEPDAKLYDLLIANEGRDLLLLPALNYSNGDSEVTREMLLHPASVLGLSDGGAHCGVICDASQPTWMLTHWARDRRRGERLPLELVVKRQTSDGAALYGFTDRGVVATGKRADLNVIDLDRLTLHPPRVAHDLPAGGRRLLQDATGYVATIVDGVVTRRHDTDTGARPGRLVRG